MPYTGMRNLAAGDLVVEADMDALRTNLDYVHLPNAVYTARGGLSSTDTSYADIAGLSAVHTAYGGMTTVVLQTFVGVTGSAGTWVNQTINLDGTNVVDQWDYWAYNYQPSGTRTLVYSTAMASGAHVIKSQWKVAGTNPTGRITTAWLFVVGG